MKKDERIHIQAEKLEETSRKLSSMMTQCETLTKRENALVANFESAKQSVSALRAKLKRGDGSCFFDGETCSSFEQRIVCTERALPKIKGHGTIKRESKGVGSVEQINI